MAIRAAADQERIDQPIAILAAAIVIKAAADQTIAENAEISYYSFSKSSLSTVSFS